MSKYFDWTIFVCVYRLNNPI